MKKILAVITVLTFSLNIPAQNVRIDTAAIMIFDQMSQIIGDLTSVSFTLDTRNDGFDPDNGLISIFSKNRVYFDGPDKMMVNSRGNNGHRGFWYNGNLLVVYSYDENNYALIDAPSGTIAMIDSVNSNYGIDFPAADFFYPTFTENLLNQSSDIIYNGVKTVADEECFHIIAKQKEMTIQLWISNNELFLPFKMLIIYHGKNEGLQYEATFSDWNLNPVLPASMFEFLAPPNAREVRIIPKTKR